MSAINFILGHGERLTETIKGKPKGGPKTPPYELNEARERLLPQIDSTLAEIEKLPRRACPLDYGVMRWTLHPQYIAKSYFPTALIQELGLESVGSRTMEIKPEKWTKKAALKATPTTELFVAGQKSRLLGIPARIRSVTADSQIADNLIALERVQGKRGRSESAD